MSGIIVKKVANSSKELLNAMGQFGAPKMSIELTGTPLANQPSPYIKATYDEKKIGAVKMIMVSAVHNGTDVFFYAEWDSPEPNMEIGEIGTFPDGFAILLPFKEPDKTPIKEMGSNDYPTNSWYWRPDFKDLPKNQVAHGLATSLYTKEASLKSHSKWENGKWHLVISRPLQVKEEAVNLAPGAGTVVGFAAWEGASGERGGVKGFSKEWMEMTVEA
jgi:steroid C-25 hydroxylase gamma subunit